MTGEAIVPDEILPEGSIIDISPDEPIHKPLRRSAPILPPAALGIGLCSNDVYTPEERARLNADLSRIADQRRIVPPDDVAVA